jgi:hypothetical protein
MSTHTHHFYIFMFTCVTKCLSIVASCFCFWTFEEELCNVTQFRTWLFTLTITLYILYLPYELYNPCHVFRSHTFSGLCRKQLICALLTNRWTANSMISWILFIYEFYSGSHDSSFSIMTWYGLADHVIGVRFPSRSRDHVPIKASKLTGGYTASNSVSTGCTQPPIQLVQGVPNLLFSEYKVYPTSNSVSTGCTQPPIQWVQGVPNLLFSEYRVYPTSYPVSTGCTQPPIQWVQGVPSLLFSEYRVYPTSYPVSIVCTQPPSEYRVYPNSYSVSTGCTQSTIQWVQGVSRNSSSGLQRPLPKARFIAKFKESLVVYLQPHLF